ncbi:endoglucanase D precursor [Cladochytrium replicatum]|nr:endoglucanase D precursor [Cladochytrium replicatum]
MKPAWNLGNTLDALPDEGSWNNPKVQASTFKEIAAAGFKGVRIPVTYNDHFASGSPSWTISSVWLDRVSTVIDQALDADLHVLVNMHHDSWNWFSLTAHTNWTEIEERFRASWIQIGTRLRCKSERVSFEPINEAPGTTEEHAIELNKINQIFVDALAVSGGFNAKRVVTLPGMNMNEDLMIKFFKAPVNFTNPWALHYHYYSPYDFAFGAWGRTIWGSASDLASLEDDISRPRKAFPDIPIVVGEWGPVTLELPGEPGATWRYADHFIRMCNKYNSVPILWDNGVEVYDRINKRFRDPVFVDVILSATKGINNSLPAGTTDGSLTTQDTSRYIFHKLGETVGDYTLSYHFNGNKLVSISIDLAGVSVIAGTDYTVTDSAIVFKAAFLKPILGTTAGKKAELTLVFSAGANTRVDLVHWDLPKIAQQSVDVKTLPTDQAYRLPSISVTKGFTTPAAIRAVRADGVFLVDSWTTVFGPLQQGYLTWSNNWRIDDSVAPIDGTAILNLTSSTIAAAVGAAQDTLITVEFFPRVPGNNVTFTLKY